MNRLTDDELDRRIESLQDELRRLLSERQRRDRELD